MRKRLACLLLTTLFLFATAFSTIAMDSDLADKESGPGTRLSYTNYTFTRLGLSSDGTALCSSSIQGYPGITTKVTIEMTLQKRFLLIFWTDEQTWTQTFNADHGTLEKKKSVSSGTYRVSTTYTAYSGSNSEVVNGTSPTATY